MNIRKYLTPVGLILAFGLSLALAQTITKSVQLSQDSTGAIGVDTNNNVYYPAHILTTGPGTPALTSCGSGTPTITGTDTAGTVALGTSATGCVITFNKAYAATPYCLVTARAGVSQVGYSTSTTALTTTQVSTSSNTIDYLCTGSK